MTAAQSARCHPAPQDVADRESGGSHRARWYVIQTLPHAENRSILSLERQGYRIFCPRVRKTVRHARKVTHSLAPLFPGYVFLNLDTAREQWRSINGTCGVVRIIACREAPQPVPIGIVEALQAQVGVDGSNERRQTFKVGEAVRIAAGPFADLIGTLDRLDASGRVHVLLGLLGRVVSVTLRSDALEVAA